MKNFTRQLLRYYIPSIAIIYTMCLTVSAIASLMLGLSYELNGITVITWLFLIALFHGIDGVISLISFTSQYTYLAATAAAQFGTLLLLNVAAGWVSGSRMFTALYLLALYAVIFISHQLYFRRVRRLEADDINRMLNSREIRQS